MNIENFNKWLRDLRSGKYEQYSGGLTGDIYEDGDFDAPEVPGYCCLGVGCLSLDALADDNPLRVDWRSMTLAPREFIEWLDLPVMKRHTDHETGESSWKPAELDDFYEDRGFDIGCDPNTSSWSAAGLNDEDTPFTEIANRLERYRDDLVAYIP